MNSDERNILENISKLTGQTKSEVIRDSLIFYYNVLKGEWYETKEF